MSVLAAGSIPSERKVDNPLDRLNADPVIEWQKPLGNEDEVASKPAKKPAKKSAAEKPPPAGWNLIKPSGEIFVYRSQNGDYEFNGECDTPEAFADVYAYCLLAITNHNSMDAHQRMSMMKDIEGANIVTIDSLIEEIAVELKAKRLDYNKLLGPTRREEGS